MDVKDLKLGATIVLDDDSEYMVIEKRKEKGKKYLVCSTTKRPIKPCIFRYEIEEEKILIIEEDDNKILETIYLKMIKENS